MFLLFIMIERRFSNKYSMKQNIDFVNAFTGSLLTEDFFDNMDNSQIAQAAGLDGDIIPE